MIKHLLTLNCFLLISIWTHAESKDTIFISQDTSYIEHEMYQFKIKKVYRVTSSYYTEFSFGNHFMNSDSTFDSNKHPLVINGLRNDGVSFRYEYSYYNDSTLKSARIYKNDTLKQQEIYSNDGRRLEYYYFLNGKVEEGYEQEIISEDGFLRKFVTYTKVDGVGRYVEDTLLYNSNDILIKVESRDSSGNILKIQNFLTNPTWSISVPGIAETYNYGPDGKLDSIVSTSDEKLIKTEKYFYANGVLDYVIVYNKKGKEMKRIDY